MSSRAKLILPILLFVFGWGSAFALSRFLYAAWFANIYFSVVLLCALIVYGHVRGRSGSALVIFSAALLILFQSLVLHLPVRLIQSLSILGFSAFMSLGWSSIWPVEEDRLPLRTGFIGTALLISLYLISMPALTLAGQLHPNVLDLYLYSFDASLHFQPSFLAGVAYFKWPLLRWLGQIFYVGLPVALAVVFAGQLISNRKRAVQAIAAFFIGGPLGIVAYDFFPALGPRYIFRADFPFHSLTTSQAARLLVEPVPVHGFINAMPSMHMAWVLLAWWYSRGLSWVYRGIAMAFFAFTVFATLGSGEHYVADLIVAFPFALLLEAICSFSLPWSDQRRLRALALGALGTLLWFLLLRFENRLFWMSPLLPWSLAIATIVAVLLAHSRLVRAIEQSLGHECETDNPATVGTFQSAAASLSPDPVGVTDSTK